MRMAPLVVRAAAAAAACIVPFLLPSCFTFPFRRRPKMQRRGACIGRSTRYWISNAKTLEQLRVVVTPPAPSDICTAESLPSAAR